MSALKDVNTSQAKSIRRIRNIKYFADYHHVEGETWSET